MSQITSGIRSVLSGPAVYELFQRLMGARASRRRFVDEFILPYPCTRVLDIGCGPADILEYLPESEYYGFDISSEYIERARKKYGDRGRFFDKYLSEDDLSTLPKFDLVLMFGVLHHVDDDTGRELMRIARNALKPGGRFITADGCLVEGQNPIARYLIENDRGQNVKSEEGYTGLARSVFADVESRIIHKAWLPYTLCYLTCTRESEMPNE